MWKNIFFLKEIRVFNLKFCVPDSQVDGDEYCIVNKIGAKAGYSADITQKKVKSD